MRTRESFVHKMHSESIAAADCEDHCCLCQWLSCWENTHDHKLKCFLYVSWSTAVYHYVFT